MNLLTGYTLILEVHPTRNSHEDYVNIVQQIAREALLHSELPTRVAMKLAAQNPRTPAQIKASQLNGLNCRKGMGGRKKTKKGKVTK